MQIEDVLFLQNNSIYIDVCLFLLIDHTEEHTSSCSDKVSDCADYGANVCTEYGGWAKENCQKHCNLCSGRSNVVNIK